MAYDDSFSAIVIDSGTNYTKVGFGGDVAPMTTFRTSIGIHKKSKSKYVAHENIINRPDFLIKDVIKNGIVQDWDHMTMIWKFCYERIGIESNEQPLLLTESPLNPPANRIKLLEIAFQELNVPALHLANASLMPLYAAGRATGIVIDCGAGVTAAVPMFEGCFMPPAVDRINFAGAGITEYLQNLLGNSYRFEICEDMKKKLAYVAKKGKDAELDRPPEPIAYKLPDGKTVNIGNERFLCAEAIFQPSLTSMCLPTEGIANLVVKSINRCNQDIRKELWANIILSGGSSFMPGFVERLYHELSILVPNAGVKIVRPHDQLTDINNPGENATWIGGSILTSLDAFGAGCVSKGEYDEMGESVTRRKFH